MKQSPTNGCCTFEKLKGIVHIASDITVQFMNDPIVRDEARGLIWKLEFNEIQRKSQ